MPESLINLSIRLTQDDLDRLDKLAARLGGVLGRTVLARHALLLGLARVEVEGLSALEPERRKTRRK